MKEIMLKKISWNPTLFFSQDNGFGLVSFSLMAYQPSQLTHCQSYPRRRTVVVLFKVSLFNGISIFVGYSMPKLSL